MFTKKSDINFSSCEDNEIVIQSNNRMKFFLSHLRHILLLTIVILISGCDMPGLMNRISNNGPYSPDWKNLRIMPHGTTVQLSRKAGIHHLIVYTGKTSDAHKEIQGVSGELQKIGYNLMTIHDTGDLKPQTANNIISLMDEAEQRPGIRKRLIILYGDQLATILEETSNWAVPPIGFIILDAHKIRESSEINRRISSLPASIPILLVAPGPIELKRVTKYFRSYHSKNLIISIAFIDHPLPINNEDPYFFPAELLTNDQFLDYLLIQKHYLKWISAARSFRGGCSFTRDGTNQVKLHELMSSGEPENELCPLYLVTNSGNLYRAQDVETNICTYRLSETKTFLYCIP